MLTLFFTLLTVEPDDLRCHIFCIIEVHSILASFRLPRSASTSLLLVRKQPSLKLEQWADGSCSLLQVADHHFAQ